MNRNRIRPIFFIFNLKFFFMEEKEITENMIIIGGSITRIVNNKKIYRCLWHPKTSKIEFIFL